MILNQQKAKKIDLAGLKVFASSLTAALGLRGREFNVCLVDDARMAQLNAAYRGKPGPTDVLSFPWAQGAPFAGSPNEFAGFLGDVVISVQTAARNAEAEGHETGAELNLLTLHGLLHLLGMDHETDRGEMTAVELDLRARLGLDGRSRAKSMPAVRRARGRGRVRPAARS